MGFFLQSTVGQGSSGIQSSAESVVSRFTSYASDSPYFLNRTAGYIVPMFTILVKVKWLGIMGLLLRWVHDSSEEYPPSEGAADVPKNVNTAVTSASDCPQ